MGSSRVRLHGRIGEEDETADGNGLLVLVRGQLGFQELLQESHVTAQIEGRVAQLLLGEEAQLAEQAGLAIPLVARA